MEKNITENGWDGESSSEEVKSDSGRFVLCYRWPGRSEGLGKPAHNGSFFADLRLGRPPPSLHFCGFDPGQ